MPRLLDISQHGVHPCIFIDHWSFSRRESRYVVLLSLDSSPHDRHSRRLVSLGNESTISRKTERHRSQPKDRVTLTLKTSRQSLRSTTRPGMVSSAANLVTLPPFVSSGASLNWSAARSKPSVRLFLYHQHKWRLSSIPSNEIIVGKSNMSKRSTSQGVLMLRICFRHGQRNMLHVGANSRAVRRFACGDGQIREWHITYISPLPASKLDRLVSLFVSLHYPSRKRDNNTTVSRGNVYF